MSLLKWKQIANEKEDVENQIKNINNQIMSSKLKDELGQVGFTKMFKPITTRLDTQIEATKKLEDEGLKDGDEDKEDDDYPLPEYPSEIETETEDEIEDEIADFEPPPSIEKKRKEWVSGYSEKQKELDKERKQLAEERRRLNALLGKLNRSGEYHIKSGKYKGVSYDELIRDSEILTTRIDEIENKLLLSKSKKQRMEYKKVPFLSSELREQSKKLKRTPKTTKSKKKPAIQKSLLDKIESIRKDTTPDSDREEYEWEGSGYDQNYKVVYYNNPEKLIKKLDVICGSINAGNTSNQIRNNSVTILDELLKLKRITKRMHEKIYNKYFI